LAYLRVIHSSKDTAALLRIVNVPSRRLGKERIAVLVKDAENQSRSLWESIQALISGEIRFATNDKAAEGALATLVRTITSIRKKLKSNDMNLVSEIIDWLRNNVNYDDYLRKKFGPNADERIGNLDELKNFALEVDRATKENVLPDVIVETTAEEETPLERFLGNIALMTDVQDAGEDKVDSVLYLTVSADDQITISTIHAAKGMTLSEVSDYIGLEWPVVFIPGMYQGSIPHLKAEDTDEERRLLYVAMTRAQGILYLSFPSKNSNGGINEDDFAHFR